jgi:hypothetical protein
MLAAYRGMPQERAPVAPEFWYYYPAKVLGVDMIAFEKEVPFWYALKETFGLWNWKDGERHLRNPSFPAVP